VVEDENCVSYYEDTMKLAEHGCLLSIFTGEARCVMFIMCLLSASR
jgi:hypothetical protein